MLQIRGNGAHLLEVPPIHLMEAAVSLETAVVEVTAEAATEVGEELTNDRYRSCVSVFNSQMNLIPFLEIGGVH